MRTVTIRIKTGNDAFVDDPAREVARILRELADRFEKRAPCSIVLPYDANGGKVGSVVVK